MQRFVFRMWIHSSHQAQRVWLTDHASNVGVLENAKHAAELNGVSSVCSVKALIWGMFCPWVVQMQVPDLIVGADILYDATEIDSVLATVSYFMVLAASICMSGIACALQYLGRWDRWFRSMLKVVKVLVFVNAYGFRNAMNIHCPTRKKNPSASSLSPSKTEGLGLRVAVGVRWSCSELRGRRLSRWLNNRIPLSMWIGCLYLLTIYGRPLPPAPTTSWTVTGSRGGCALWTWASSRRHATAI